MNQWTVAKKARNLRAGEVIVDTEGWRYEIQSVTTYFGSVTVHTTEGDSLDFTDTSIVRVVTEGN